VPDHVPFVPEPGSGARLGRVITFDPVRGLGTVVVEGAQGAELGFHATALVDGSRRVDVGTPVAFVVRDAHGGRYEAWSLVSVRSHQRPA
jgi:hypothetical protein